MQARRSLCSLLLFASWDLGYQVGPYPDGVFAFLDAGRDAAAARDASARASDAAQVPPAPAAVPDGAPACPARETTVSIRNLAFQTPALTIKAGTRVTWINEDIPHDVTEGDPGNPRPAFASPLLQTGQRWSRNFCTPGRFKYHCAVHPNLMRDATVTIEP